MLSFTSIYYYLFLLSTALIYFLSARRFRPAILMAASYFFYASFEPRYLGFIVLTTLTSFFISRAISKTTIQRDRKLLLSCALLIEFSVLGLTKYWNPISLAVGHLPLIDIIVPLGISFYTFQSVGYLIDVYRKTIQAEPSFLKYAAFLSFFPHLLAGPIEPAQDFLPQMASAVEDPVTVPLKLNVDRFALGSSAIMIGLFKKLVIADRLAPIVDHVFAGSQSGGAAVYVGAILARYQIYCDFSGYTDIATGSAQFFGIKLMANFNRPFFANSITEFWRRWHISLGVWIRKYIFFPLITTRLSGLGVHGIVFITFLVLGVWHGGTINFLIYGASQGLFIIMDDITRNHRTGVYRTLKLDRYPNFLNALCIFFTFTLFVVPPIIFFRSSDEKISASLVSALFRSWHKTDLSFIFDDQYHLECLMIAVSGILLLELFDWIKSRTSIEIGVWKKSKLLFCIILLFVALLVFIFGAFKSESRFIYMQF